MRALSGRRSVRPPVHQRRDAAVLYEGTVRHVRHVPAVHRFSHRVYMTCLDLDQLPHSLDGIPGWSARRVAPSRFRRSDYFDGSEEPLAEGIRALVGARTGRRPGGRVLMLTNLRTWGWLFNPITVYWCLDEQDRVGFVVLEVTNTPWGERTHYVLDLTSGETVHHVTKVMHVSPFIDMEVSYRITVSEPGRSVALRIEVLDESGVVLDTSLAVRGVPLTRARAVGVLIRQPFMTGRVSAAIHLHAARLWRKRVPVVAHPDHRVTADADPEATKSRTDRDRGLAA